MLIETAPADRFGIIYCFTHRESGKQYVGQTVRPFKKRLSGHLHGPWKGSSAIHSAVTKYGQNAFDMDMVDWASSQEELDRKERFWIAFLATMSPKGYNLKDGGGNGKPSPETRARMSRGQKGRKWAPDDIRRVRGMVSPNKGRSMGAAQKDKLRQAALSGFALGRQHPLLGKKCSPEEVERNRQSHLGLAYPSRRRAVQCVETGQVFESGLAAAEWLQQEKGLTVSSSTSALSQARDKPAKTCGGLHWVTIMTQPVAIEGVK